jgi:hypothetical protein
MGLEGKSAVLPVKHILCCGHRFVYDFYSVAGRLTTERRTGMFVSVNGGLGILLGSRSGRLRSGSDQTYDGYTGED